MATYTLKIEQDDDIENPLTAYDCQPLVIVLDYDHHHTTISHYEDGKHYQNSMPDLPELTREQILTNLTTLKDGYVSTLQWLRDTDYESYQGIVDHVNDIIIPDMIEQARASDKLDVIESIYTMAGIECYQHYQTGYSQGHTCEVLVVADEHWREVSGCKQTGPDLQSNLKSTAETYASWCFGDCYGYRVVELDDEGEELDELAACWGYYGDDHTYLIEAAKNSITLLPGDILVNEEGEDL